MEFKSNYSSSPSLQYTSPQVSPHWNFISENRGTIESSVSGLGEKYLEESKVESQQKYETPDPTTLRKWATDMWVRTWKSDERIQSSGSSNFNSPIDSDLPWVRGIVEIESGWNEYMQAS